MSKVWILAKTGYEEFTVCGVYLDHDLAERERIRLEQVANAHRDGFARRHRESVQLSLYEYEADRTLVEIVVRIRRDGAVTETDVRLGTVYNDKQREPEWWGAADNVEDALRMAYVASPQSVRIPVGPALGYLAGLIDGEGSIGIRKTGVPYFSVYNTSVAMMNWLKVNVGGAVGGSPDMRGRVPCYHWAVQAQNDVQALGRALLPFLLVKGRDCETVLEWIRRRQCGR